VSADIAHDTAPEVDRALGEFFELAHKWGCVLRKFQFQWIYGLGKPSESERIPLKTMAAREDGNRGCLTSVSD
jgi:hypothetical protein